MNNDIIPPKKRPQSPQQPPVPPSGAPIGTVPQQPQTPPQQPTPVNPPQTPPQMDNALPQTDSSGFNTVHMEEDLRYRDYADEVSNKPPATKQEIKEYKRWKFRWLRRAIVFFSGVFVLAAIAVGVFMYLLLPPDGNSQDKQKLVIKSGMTPTEIAAKLKNEGLIRNELIFRLYAKLSKTENNLQAGTYRLAKAESTQDIVAHLVKGGTDTMNITFFPGATLVDTHTEDESKRADVTSVLKRAGYSESEIAEALKKQYDHPLFKDKPKTANLEGYVYGETYNVPTESSVSDILKVTFDEYEKVLKKYAIEERAKKYGLNKYQVITLASIIEREVSCVDRSKTCEDQQMVAQVFHKRLKEGIQLGSDVTFIYAAHKMGVEPRINLDSPYNTRVKTGMPPGPIATPGVGALMATVDPAKTDFLYFVAGDNGKTYFAKTETDHEVNVQVYCKKLCK